MRVVAKAASISWIPSESIASLMRLGMELGLSHWDDPPPDRILIPGDVHDLCGRDRFRFANVIAAWADVEDGTVTHAAFANESELVMGATTVRLGGVGATFRGISLPTLRSEPEVRDGQVTFVQTVGGRTAVPLPRRVARKPYVQWAAPTVWTTVALTLRADGSSDVQLRGASAFPRHWVFAPDGKLAMKSGLTDDRRWLGESFGEQTPWGSQDSPIVVSAVESDLERHLSTDIMRPGVRPEIRRLPAGTVFTRQGERGDELLLVLDGVVSVDVDGTTLGEVGPGAVLGERAVLEGGRRTSTLTAVTPVRLAVAVGSTIDLTRLRELAESHRREHS
jgi:hypothetical protein